MSKYCYSWDGTNYSNGPFNSEEEAIADAKETNTSAEEVWIGTITEPKLRWFSNEEGIIDSMYENLREDCGDFADDFEIPLEQERELASMIDETVQKWIEKNHIKPDCYQVLDGALYTIREVER